MSRPVDVVIPIYDAAADVERCVDSVLANTRHPEARVVLADDASPDPAIGGLLERFVADQRVELRRSDRNLGFVANCNAAMRASDRDIVLLNSDTEVGPGWLGRLAEYAYLVDRVGSVTPWSDNATICSVPRWFESNRFPDRVSTEDLDRVATDLATHELLDLPTGVGFCLYLRRDALDAVGLFDEAAFGRGYGEENDLCCRMRHAGYLNLLADGVFVRHRGGASFQGTGRLAENLDVLRRRWPAYSRAVQEIRERDPFGGLRARFGAELALRGRDPSAIRPLYVLHYRVRIGRKGGTEHHVQDLVDGAGTALDPLVLAFEDGAPVVQWDADGAGTAFPGRVGPQDLSWVDRLVGNGVDVLHVHHPKRMPLDVLERLHVSCRDRSIPVVWTLHDYFAICPCIQLVHPDGIPCPSAEGEHCPECDELSHAEDGVGLAERRDRFRRLVSGADRVLSPSAAAAALQAELLDIQLPEVVPHGTAMERRAVRPPVDRSRPTLVVLGYSAPQKGNDVAARLVRALDGVDWVFLGRRHLPGIEPGGTVRFIGEYDRDHLGDLLEDIAPDAIVLLSTWPETFLYTLSEARRCGIPVFGSDVGAMGERLRAGGGGVLLPPDDPAGAASVIRTKLVDDEEMHRLRDEARAAGDAEPSVEEMAGTYVAMYRDLVGERRRPAVVVHPAHTDDERSGWLGSFPVPFPSEDARPLRQADGLQ